MFYINHVVTLALALYLALPYAALAVGIAPESSLVIINEADGEGTMNVKNTDMGPVLLYTRLRNLPEDGEQLLLVTPPVARLEPGQTQLVRFILTSNTPLHTERLRRVAFEGISQATQKNAVQLIIRHDLPVIVRPAKLAQDDQPWKRLHWTISGGVLEVNNSSPYVVRLAQQVMLLPKRLVVVLPKAYLLPGDNIQVKLPQPCAEDCTSVRLAPATAYGYAVDFYDAPLADALHTEPVASGDAP